MRKKKKDKIILKCKRTIIGEMEDGTVYIVPENQPPGTEPGISSLFEK